MTLFDSPAFEGHEGVHAFFDEKTGLKAIIAVHSTARGPACGGTRMWPYATAEAALDDVLKLSRAMSFKNAVADLELGGGKSVIIGDSRTQKSPALFEAFGRAVDQLGGRYWAAEDVGVSPSDLMSTRKTTRYVVGLEGGAAASGDPSPVTAEGVYRCTVAVADRVWGKGALNGLTVALQGVGHVGGYLADKLHAAGAKLIITDVNEAALRAVADRTGAVVVKPDEIYDAQADIFAPCALGGAVNAETLGRLKGRAIVGAANNQLASPEIGREVFSRGLVYAPDYVVNAGGIINVASEVRALNSGGAYDPAWVESKVARIAETLGEILDRSAADRRPTDEIALEIARARIAAAQGARIAA
ncbi:MAG TPA: Glu/Leu/Phe/Val dehydrogenase dimerization domain-containing protein [Caulobacteraceae bacterium]|jgi:leucine dehydrogenase